MGRRFPAVIRYSSSSSSSQGESLYLAFACLAITASLAVMYALCGSHFRRKSNTSTDKEAEQPSSLSPPAASSPPRPEPQESSGRMSLDALLPPRRQLDSNGSQSMKPKSKAGRRMSNTSRVGKSLSMPRRWSRKETGATSATGTSSSSASVQKMKAKLEKEDSIWMKTIILGDKCRVEDEDDPVIFDDQGLKVIAYHPKAASSLPVSRSSSYIDQDAIPPTASKRTGEAST